MGKFAKADSAGNCTSGGGGGGPHAHAISDVTNLQSTLDGKAASNHSHTGIPSTCKLTADLAASTSTTLANATGLSFSVTSGVYYYFKFAIIFRTAATTTGLKLSLTLPAATVFSASARVPFAADAAAGAWHGWITTSGDAVTATGVQAANTDYVAIVEGIILPSANGTLQFQFATEVAASAVTVRQGSCGFLYSL